MDFGEPDRDKQLIYIYITGKQGTGTYNFVYTLANSTFTNNVTLNQAGTGIFNHRISIKNLPSVKNFYYTISSTHPIEIHSINSYYKIENLRE